MTFQNNVAGQYIHLDGTGYVDIPDSPSLDLPGTGTISLFVKADPLFNIHSGLVTKVSSSTYAGQSSYDLTWGSNIGEHLILSDGSTWNWAWNSGAALSDGQWHHVVASWSGLGGKISIYRDGVLVSEADQTIASLNNTAEAVRIGVRRWNVGGIYQYFTGDIDEGRIYNRALSAIEVHALYQLGTEPDINVDPQQYDFGEVEVGRHRTMFLTLSNSGGSDLVVNDIHMKYLISGNPFTFTLPKALPITIAPSAAVEVEVAYSPTFLYAMQSNTLVIGSNDSDEGTLEIPLQGQGIVAATSSQAVAQILYYIDYAVGQGLIVGEGNGNSPEKRINVLKNMIKSAGDLIDNGDITGACEQLGSILKKVDGQINPPDFISGSGTPGVAGGISGIMTNLGCN